MGKTIDGNYLVIEGQTLKVGQMWYGDNWPFVTIETTGIGFQYEGGRYPYAFVEIGEPFSIYQYFAKKYGDDLSEWPHEQVRFCFDPEGNQVEYQEFPFFYFGYEYDSTTNRVKFIGGFSTTSAPNACLKGYDNLGYTGMSLSGTPTETDKQLSLLFFFVPQQVNLPDVTAYMGTLSDGYRTFMNGELVRQSDSRPMLFYDCSTPNPHDIIPIPLSVGVRGAYMPDIMYQGPNPIPEQQALYMCLKWEMNQYFGAGRYEAVPPKLITEEPASNIHWGDDPAPVGIGGNGQYVYDPDDGDGSLDFDPENGAVESGFAHIYAPTKQELKSLSSYLWNSDFWSSVAKMLNDPMDAIISLMRVPIDLTPYRDTTVNCICGNKDTGVPMSPLTESFIKLKMGVINLSERWGTAVDYPPYTNCVAYLPYVGFVSLNVNDLYEEARRGNTKLYCTYRINTFTGDLTAMLHMKRHNDKGEYIRYMVGHYAGNCAFQIPVTASNYSRFMSNVFDAGISAATAAATGGATAGIQAGASVVNALTSAAAGGNPEVQRSGNFSGGSTALEYYLPFLIMYEPIQAMDGAGFGRECGFPASAYKQVKANTGYMEAAAVILDGFTGTQEEAAELERLLKGGVIVHHAD